jgi:hypothetical protein
MELVLEAVVPDGCAVRGEALDERVLEVLLWGAIPIGATSARRTVSSSG